MHNVHAKNIEYIFYWTVFQCIFKPALNFFSGGTTEFNCSTAELEFWPLFSFLNTVLRLMYTCTKTECHHLKLMRLFLCSRKCFFFVVPPPSIQVTHDGGNRIFPGTRLSLSCNIMLDATLDPRYVAVTITWTRPNGQTLFSNRRVTVSEANVSQSNTKTYTSNVIFSFVRMDDSGSYTCKATLANSSAFIINSMSMDTEEILIQGI